MENSLGIKNCERLFGSRREGTGIFGVGLRVNTRALSPCVGLTLVTVPKCIYCVIKPRKSIDLVYEECSRPPCVEHNF